MATTIDDFDNTTTGHFMSQSARRLIRTVNVIAGIASMTALVGAHGLAERLVTAQEVAPPGTLAAEHLQLGSLDWSITLGMSLLLLGGAAGAIGSVIQQSITFAHRAGHETLEQGFVWWYVLRLVWSGLLGAITVTAVHAGLVGIGHETTSTAGITVLVTAGSLAGLFTDRVLDRLGDVPRIGSGGLLRETRLDRQRGAAVAKSTSSD